ncbi:SPARC-like [Amphiura filiformis]|uniref:SPARC-like n=1 Tax=Amphiura filiformis TaxID=82378 RepID=UPI003B20C595
MEFSLQCIFLIFSAALVVAQDVLPQGEQDPCLDKRCKKPAGSMCIPVLKGDKWKPKCKCPEDCTNERLDPVCSVYGKQYNNLCELHLYGCNKGKNIMMAYKGECVASQEECVKDELMQFPHRVLEWFLHLKEIDEFGQLDSNNNIRKISDEERETISRWKFDQLDRKHDDSLDARDLKEFRFALMPLEHCASKFFAMCDIDKNSKISYEEWTDCLMIYDRPEEGVVNSQTYIANAQVNVVDSKDKRNSPEPEEEEVEDEDEGDVVEEDEEDDI